MVASFRLIALNPAISWPVIADMELTEISKGWSRQQIQLETSKSVLVVVEANCFGELCVHRMIDHEGFTITTIANGLRLFSKGRVFARCMDAMSMVERLVAAYSGWTEHTDGRRSVPLDIGRAFTQAHDEAEKRGEILRDVVFPE